MKKHRSRDQKRFQKRKRREQHRQREYQRMKDRPHGKQPRHSRHIRDMLNTMRYLEGTMSDQTSKDRRYSEWLTARHAEVQKEHGPQDALTFIGAATAVSEFERLYDTIEMCVGNNFPEVNTDAFFTNVTMYIGKNVRGVYHYLTDWKTLMFTIAGNIPEAGLFPVLGCHYDVVSSPNGLIGIQKKNGEMMAIIPVVTGAERNDPRIYPQNGEPLENGDLACRWEEWYELNKLIDNEQEWFKMMRWYDEVLNHMLKHDLFNNKKVNIA